LRQAKQLQRAILSMASQHRYRLTEQSDKLDDPVSERNIAIWQHYFSHEYPQDRWPIEQRCPLATIPTQ